LVVGSKQSVSQTAADKSPAPRDKKAQQPSSSPKCQICVDKLTFYSSMATALKLVENSCCEPRTLSLRKPQNFVRAVHEIGRWPEGCTVTANQLTKILMSVSDWHKMSCSVQLQSIVPRDFSYHEG
jgi:hypothetical protein